VNEKELIDYPFEQEESEKNKKENILKQKR
jgi:hypothetical protein